MADPQKPSWWSSIPGILTAATGFVAALSGLVAGLIQLGVLKRDQQPAVQSVAQAPAARDTEPESVAPMLRSDSQSRRVTPVAPRARTPPTAPKPSPVTQAAPKPAAAAAPTRTLPKGATLDLVVRSRTCVPAGGSKRFLATVAPVTAGGDTLLPARASAVLHLHREDGAAPQARLDSLLPPSGGLAVPASQLRFQRWWLTASCLREGARLSATLGAPVALRSK